MPRVGFTAMATRMFDFSKPHVLRTLREYNAAVAEVDKLLDTNPKKGTPEDDQVKALRDRFGIPADLLID